MKIRTRELAKPGIYGSVENPIVVTENELREMAETFADIKKAPVSLSGHWPDPSRPRIANVVSLAFDENTKILSGSIEEHDSLAAAVDGGFYPDVSIGGNRRAEDGKMYLHHLAYLGEEPPAVKDLVDGVLADLGAAEKEELAASDGSADKMIPPIKTRLLALSDPAATNPGPDAGSPGDKKPKEAPMPKTPEELAKELETMTAENTRLKDQLSALAKKYPDAGIQLSDAPADPRIDEFVKQIRTGKREALVRAAAGKIPKAKQDLIVSLSDSFSTSESIELSDGDKKVKKSQYDILADLLESIPPLVRPGRLDLSDGDGEKPLDRSKIKGKF